MPPRMGVTGWSPVTSEWKRQRSEEQRLDRDKDPTNPQMIRGPAWNELPVLMRQLEEEKQMMTEPWAPPQGRNPHRQPRLRVQSLPANANMPEDKSVNQR